VKRFGNILLMTLTLIAATAVTGWAGDNIQVSVQDISPAASIKINGNDVTQGNLQLWYTVNAYSFPTGVFGTFRIDMKALHINGLTNASYPATMTLKQNGSQNLTLTPASSTIEVPYQGWEGSTVVTISIPSGVPNEDGTDLVGNLNFSIPASKKIGTPTSVQVHIRLVHPTFCVKVYNFMADAGADNILADTFQLDVKVKNGVVNSASPGTVSYNMLIANTCGQDRTVDIGAVLDSSWEVSGAQGVKLYSANGEIDLSGYDNSLFSGGLNNGTDVCFGNATIPNGKTVLLNVKTKMEDGVSEASVAVSPFTFSGSVREADTSCSGNLDPLASPNPVSAGLEFTTTTIGSARK
jgi:hypothetical protein